MIFYSNSSVFEVEKRPYITHASSVILGFWPDRGVAGGLHCECGTKVFNYRNPSIMTLTVGSERGVSLDPYKGLELENINNIILFNFLLKILGINSDDAKRIYNLDEETFRNFYIHDSTSTKTTLSTVDWTRSTDEEVYSDTTMLPTLPAPKWQLLLKKMEENPKVSYFWHNLRQQFGWKTSIADAREKLSVLMTQCRMEAERKVTE
ncbi:hypothetical protein ADUPG1_011550, partial [Aduncisulcus paluster]